MICSHCRTFSVTWRGPLSALTHTECSRCGGINCHVVEEEPEAEEEPASRVVITELNLVIDGKKFDKPPSAFLFPMFRVFQKAAFKSQRSIVMNGTRRPRGMWRIAGMGPFEWIISHRSFLRMMDEDIVMPSIYTPKRQKPKRKTIPGLDYSWRKFRTHPREDFPF